MSTSIASQQLVVINCVLRAITTRPHCSGSSPQLRNCFEEAPPGLRVKMGGGGSGPGDRGLWCGHQHTMCTRPSGARSLVNNTVMRGRMGGETCFVPVVAIMRVLRAHYPAPLVTI